jgi:serine/threonine protein kinase
MAMSASGEPFLSNRFRIVSKLSTGATGVVYEALDTETGAHVAIKTLSAPSPEHLYWLKSEFRHLADIHHPNLIRLGELFVEAGRYYFTMELVRGTDFHSYVHSTHAISGARLRQADRYVRAGAAGGSDRGDSRDAPRRAARARRSAGAMPRSPATFDEVRLRASLEQLAAAIAAVHSHGLVHRDLKPSNVLVEATGRVVVLDFGIAGTLREADDGGAGGDGIVGTPAYMAPEQVLGEPPSTAADWYAFGVMLFQGLTNRLPFEGPLTEVLQAKVVGEAARASALVDGVPPDLDALCSALLRLDAKRRPTGSEVLERLAQGPGSHAISLERAPASKIFVGRVPEIEQLWRAFDVTLSGGFAGVLIEGAPGTGKTELVENFFAGLRSDASGPVLLRGRCYEQEFVPLKGFDALLDALSHHLKHRPEDDVKQLLPTRPALLAALFPVLYRVPAFAAAVPPPELNEANPQERLEAVGQLVQLLTAVARENPMALFIDDLQWAGEDSLELLRGVFAAPDAPPVLLVATRRTTDPTRSEVASAEPALDATVIGLFERIRLDPLSEEDSVELLRQLLPDPGAIEEADVARLLAEAAGHPLFLQELARYARDGAKLGSELRLDQVLQARIGRLDPASRRVLEAASVAGVPVPARVLGRVAGLERASLSAALTTLRSDHLVRIARTDASHRTVEPYHDRIREAVVDGVRAGSYRLTDDRDLAEVHLELGRELARAREEDGLSVPTTLIANQYDLGAAAITRPEERLRAAGLALDAARQMKLASAYDAATRYIAGARGHLGPAPEDEARGLGRQADVLEMQIALLANDASLADRTFERLAAKSRDELELAEAYEARATTEMAKAQFSAAVATAREGLRRLSMRAAGRGSSLLLLLEIARLELKLLGQKPANLADVPVQRDDRVRAQIQLLGTLAAAAYFCDVTWMAVCIVRAARMALSRGLADVSAYACIGYALILAGVFRKYQRAFEFSLLAKALNERHPNPALDAKLVYMHAYMVSPYVRPLEDSRADMRRAQELGLANGDLTFRAYAAATTPSFSFTMGRPLSETATECIDAIRVAQEGGHVDQVTSTSWFYRGIRALQGETENVMCMDGGYTEDQRESWNDLARLPVASFACGLMQLVLGNHFDDDALARMGAERADRAAHVQFGLLTLVTLSFYETLAACRSLARQSRPGRWRVRWAIRRGLRRLETWARACDANFGSYFLLARGEYHRALGEREAARRDLEEALRRAEGRETHPVAALANERLAGWHETYGSDRDARASVRAAIDAYRRWGAAACVARLTAPHSAGDISR